MPPILSYHIWTLETLLVDCLLLLVKMTFGHIKMVQSVLDGGGLLDVQLIQPNKGKQVCFQSEYDNEVKFLAL
jgi:hypothetical protein